MEEHAHARLYYTFLYTRYIRLVSSYFLGKGLLAHVFLLSGIKDYLPNAIVGCLLSERLSLRSAHRSVLGIENGIEAANVISWLHNIPF